MRLIVTLTFACVLASCASSHQQVTTPQTAKLLSGGSILIATPLSVSSGEKLNSDSGRMTAGALRSAFARHSNRVSVVSECKDIDCLQRKSSGAADYLVVPQILRWEDRDREWAGYKDKVEIKVIVVDAKAGNDLAAAIIGGKSTWLKFEDRPPQDILAKPFGEFVDSLFE